ncbi:Swt1 family HEPN domain-containing protein [Actinomadura verrucosospora]|uniref:Swt1-like HEPN domain-containing protein n=1 Tax=Actinomadura verrucosospora TaxID=46165 RepID=A0A7D3ZM12_ACTVE|nr:Swt1 family HEPN domain-containing protein [Actinomadura verrucosospora]QKG21802.1 hypothetical protein ACTIVE_3440 [Actinomadura verrucosospora]
MRTTGNRDLIGQGLENLLEGLRPFVDRTMTAAWGTGWVAEKERRDNERYGTDGRRGYSLNDARFLLNVIVQEREIFKPVLPRPGLSLASKLRVVGRKYGHQYNSDAFADDETRQALHTMAQLLSLAGATAATRAVADLTARVGAGASAPPPPGPESPSPPPPGAAPPPPPPPGPGAPYGAGPRGGYGYPPPPPGGPYAPPPGGPYAPPRPAPRPATAPGPAGAAGTGFAKGFGISGGVVAGCLIGPLVLFVAIIVMVKGCSSTPPPPAPNDDGTSAAASASGGKRLGSYRNVRLTAGYYIRLSHDPAHPRKYPAMPDADESKNLDVGVQYGYVDASGDAEMALLPAGAKGDYKTCRNTTNYEDRIEAGKVAGRRLCLIAADGATGLLTVRNATEHPAGITFDLTVWTGPKPK